MKHALAASALVLWTLVSTGCEELEYREDHYACTPSEPSTCPDGWVCRWSEAGQEDRCFRDGSDTCGPDNCDGCCSTSGVCETGDLDALCGSGGLACEGCAENTERCEQGACVPCECTTGGCCDGCHYQPDTYMCGALPGAAEFRCDGVACGGAVQQRVLLRYCTGASEECTDDNTAWGPWETVEGCGVDQLCWADTGAAGCSTCMGGCDADACLCYDPDGDGYGQGCAAGADCDDTDGDIHPGATDLCANCVDEDCAGGDLGCDGSTITFTPPSPGLGDTVTVRVDSPQGYPSVCMVVLAPIPDVHNPTPDFVGTSDPFYWTWDSVITLSAPGTYRFEFWMDWVGGPSCDPSQYEVKVCHELVVN